MKKLLNPDHVVWITGEEDQLNELRDEAVRTGEMIKLNEEKLPGCFLHRTKPNDVARVENRTFICSRTKENAGPTNNWCDPQEMYQRLYDIARGTYAGRTMYIIPFSMGPVGSPLAKIGIEVTDSIYVVLNMAIMTRVGQKVLDVLGDSDDWVRGLHAKCDVDPEKRYICQFPEDNTIISVNSAYGGNVLLGKKCFALRIASYQGWKEGWMAEHMLILGLQNPKGEVKYIAAAFPSACFSSLIAANSFKTMLPKINSTVSVSLGGLAAILLAIALQKQAGAIVEVLNFIGVSFGPICGAIFVEYFLCKGQWGGPRKGFNPAGWLAWAVGFGVGVLPMFGVCELPMPPVVTFAIGAVVYLIAMLAGLKTASK